MERLLRKALIIGMGAAALTKERMETLLDDLSKTAERVGEEDLLSQIIKKGEETREELGRRIVEELERLIVQGKFATREDILRLEKKIDSLEKTIEGQKK